MAANKVQFQRGLSMAEFLEHYGSEDGCEASLIASRWPQGFACPVCGGPASCSFRREGRLYWQCASCRHQCSVISGTIFESTKLPLTSWFLAMHLLTQSKNNVPRSTLQIPPPIDTQTPPGRTGEVLTGSVCFFNGVGQTKCVRPEACVGERWARREPRRGRPQARPVGGRLVHGGRELGSD